MTGKNATVRPLGQPKLSPISSLKPAKDNPRKISPKAVEITAKSIKRFGWQQPIIVDADNVIIAGHTRTQAAQQLGLTQVPVIVAEHLTPEEAHAYRIADNRTSDFTTWDFPELVKQLDELSDEFSDELALADWEGIIDEFESRDSGDDLAEIELDEETDAAMSMEHSLVVVCVSDEAMQKLQLILVDREEVIDVRYKR
ncbi:ParB N-terminal domain-containing protein [Corynebacterium striatum]